MANLKSIKSKIISYKKTGTVTHAMEAVSAVKMRKSQERALGGRAYSAAALSVLERLSGTADLAKHPLMQPAAGKTCFIVVVSDKGLAGSLNSGVIRRVEEDMRTRNLKKEDVCIIGIGRRGAEHFANRGFEVLLKKENLSDAASESSILEVTNLVLELHAAGKIGTAVVAYQNFISTFEQQPVTRQVVPITQDLIKEMIAGIRPAKGKYAPQSDEAVRPSAYTIEPDADTVLSILLPRLLNIAVFYAVLEAKASEHSARMVAMKSATDKAKEMAHNLTRTFNKVRQAAITREVSEITSGIEAMR
ncbi:ATP synthase F1 subunit gamma [Candidatus Kaiserbacteria bacterium]|nr:ATP synthase F1 subunit gamma [Candidatus Kaiserbacteria bacterium]